MLRQLHKRLCWALLERRLRQRPPLALGPSALVVAPHFDDETLGMGGTIILKRRQGARVCVAFMTDGSRSHVSAMDGQAQAALRKQESLEATAALGIPASDVYFLDYPEGRLAEHREEAAGRVAALLDLLRCEQLFVPSALEPRLWSADHNATTGIVERAVAAQGARPELLEYVVWYWYHWPWVPINKDMNRTELLGLSWRYGFGLGAWRAYGAGVPVGDVLGEKRTALDRYRSQMTRLRSDRPWPILADVGRGEFLARFFAPIEVFRRSDHV